MVSRDREQITISAHVPSTTSGTAAAREWRAVRHTVRTVEALFDRFTPSEVERIVTQIDRVLIEAAPEAPDDPFIGAAAGGCMPSQQERIRLELANLHRTFQLRRALLADALTAPEVAALLGTSRQTPHDRADAGSLLAVRDQGMARFPRWQFDPEGPDGVVAGLPDVLRALHVPPLSKASWLTRSNIALEGRTPLIALNGGEVERVIRLAQAVGFS